MLSPLKRLSPLKTDMAQPDFTYSNRFEDTMGSVHFDPAVLSNKLVDQVIRTPGRVPSPQPTHFSVPARNNGHSGNGNGNGHRLPRSASVGYVAPKFEGKDKQMEEG